MHIFFRLISEKTKINKANDVNYFLKEKMFTKIFEISILAESTIVIIFDPGIGKILIFFQTRFF